MAGGIWDSNLKQLVTANAQDFVSWLLEDARIVRELSEHLNRAIDIDLLYEVERTGGHELFHLEIQRYRDVDMSERVWEYNVSATCKNNLTASSFVLYLKRDGIIAESPYIRRRLDGQEIHRFYFVNVKLWEVPTEALRATGLVGLLPLLPLSREGATPEVVEEVIEQLQQIEDAEQHKSMLSIALTLASLALMKPGDKQWLARRFKMYQDIMRDSEIYQLIVQEGIEKGIQQGIQQGVQQGIQQGVQQGIQQGVQQGIQQGVQQGIQQEMQNLRSLALSLLQQRFPELQVLASATVPNITSKEELSSLILNVGSAKTTKEAQQLLAKAGKQTHN